MPDATSSGPRLLEGGEGRYRISPSSILVVVGASVGAALASWAASQHPELFHFELLDSSAGWIVVGIVMLGAAWMFRRPSVAPPLLVFFVYLNLSQILVRYHSLPSALQLLSLPFALLALLEIRRGALTSGRRGGVLFLLLCAYNILLFSSSTVALDRALVDERWVENSKALLIFTFVVLLASKRPVVLASVRALVGSAALLSSLTLIQVLFGNYDNEMWGLARVKDAQIYGEVFEKRVAGPLGDPNFFAQVLLLAVPFGVVLAWRQGDRTWRLGAGIAAAAIVAATLVTYSRGGALALVLVLAGCALIHPKRAQAIFVLVLLGGLVVPVLPESLSGRLLTMTEVLPGEESLHPDSAIEERRLYTEVALEMFLLHPWLGVGAGNYTVHFQERADQIGSDARGYGDPDARTYPHSLFLEIGAETGVVGLLLFAAIVATCLLSLWRSRLRFMQTGDDCLADLSAAAAVALLGYLVAALFLHGHHQRYLWLLFALIAALSRVPAQPATCDR